MATSLQGLQDLQDLQDPQVLQVLQDPWHALDDSILDLPWDSLLGDCWVSETEDVLVPRRSPLPASTTAASTATTAASTTAASTTAASTTAASTASVRRRGHQAAAAPRLLWLHTPSPVPFCVTIAGSVYAFDTAYMALHAQKMLHVRGGPRPDLIAHFAVNGKGGRKTAEQAQRAAGSDSALLRQFGIRIDATSWKAAMYGAARRALRARAKVDEEFAAACMHVTPTATMKYVGVYRQIAKMVRLRRQGLMCNEMV